MAKIPQYETITEMEDTDKFLIETANGTKTVEKSSLISGGGTNFPVLNLWSLNIFDDFQQSDSSVKVIYDFYDNEGYGKTGTAYFTKKSKTIDGIVYSVGIPTTNFSLNKQSENADIARLTVKTLEGIKPCGVIIFNQILMMQNGYSRYSIGNVGVKNNMGVGFDVYIPSLITTGTYEIDLSGVGFLYKQAI